MRLTLRTLLAYLDDTLEQGLAKEIGKRVEESPHAKSIVERIRQTVRNPTVIAPSPDSEGIDANDVAEYLDNQLDADQVAELEKKILTSDMNLAETASVHQILSLILSESADVTDYDFKRLYNIHAHEKRKYKKKDNKNKSIPPIEPLMSEPYIPLPLVQEIDPIADLSPAPARRSTNSVIAVAAVVLVSIALVAVVWISLIPSEKDANKKRLGGGERQLAAANSKEIQSDGDALNENPELKKEDEKRLPNKQKEAEKPAAIPNPREARKNELTEKPKDDGKNKKSAEEEPAKEETSNKPVEPIQPKDAAKNGKDEPANATPAAIGIVTDLGSNMDLVEVLFAKGKNNKARRLMKTKDEIFPGETVAGAYGFRTVIDVGGASHFDIIDGCQLQLKSARTDEIAFDYKAGKTVLRCDDSTKVSLTFQSESIVIQTKKPQTRIAFEPSTGESTNSERAPESWPMRLTMMLVAGEAEISRATSPTISLNAGQQVDLVVGKGLEAVRPIDLPPGWILSGRGSGDPKAANRFSGLLADKPVEEALRQMTGQSTKDIRKLAVFALTSLGAEDSLLNAVRETKHADVRHVATDSIKQYLREDPRRLAGFQSRLKVFFPGVKGEALGEMAMGFTADSVPDLALCERMVKWLEFDDLWVREMAINSLKALHEDNDLGYFPEATASRRKPSVGLWQDWLKELKRKSGALPEAKKG